ncbi:MAG: hypothetical protein GMKNLPBB_01088 [Myxococcota bacterium]|nr:hypothetical protein [Myxococcota bacterium]
MAEMLNPLADAVRAHLKRETGGAVTIHALGKLPGGACQDNWKLDAEFSAGELQGRRRLVLRADARQSLPGSISRADEFQVIRAARAAGVATPAARFPAQDLTRPGATSYFLDWVEGEAIGRRVVRNPELENARARLPVQLAENLARLHSITPASAPEVGFASRGGERAPPDPVADIMEFLRRMLDEMKEVHPGLELAARWLEDHPPENREVTLVHGDFRTGNFMVTPDGLSAILDWEFSRFGNPCEDLAWICVRDWRFNRLNLPVGGFSRREPFLEAYARASGRHPSTHDLLWWEVLGNVRWAAGSVYQGERFLSGEENDIEYIAIARRAVEMEWEALRLIENAQGAGG